MKKRKILVAILVVIAITAFIASAIVGNKQATSEKRLFTVISSFLAQDYVWDVSKEKLSYPEYIEISYDIDNLEGFFIMFPLYDDGYRMYYSTSIGKPDFWVESLKSVKGTHIEFADIFSICKRLQYDTCLLKISEETVEIETVRIFRDGTIKAKDISGTWHQIIIP